MTPFLAFSRPAYPPPSPPSFQQQEPGLLPPTPSPFFPPPPPTSAFAPSPPFSSPFLSPSPPPSLSPPDFPYESCFETLRESFSQTQPYFQSFILDMCDCVTKDQKSSVGVQATVQACATSQYLPLCKANLEGESSLSLPPSLSPSASQKVTETFCECYSGALIGSLNAALSGAAGAASSLSQGQKSCKEAASQVLKEETDKTAAPSSLSPTTHAPTSQKDPLALGDNSSGKGTALSPTAIVFIVLGGLLGLLFLLAFAVFIYRRRRPPSDSMDKEPSATLMEGRRERAEERAGGYFPPPVSSTEATGPSPPPSHAPFQLAAAEGGLGGRESTGRGEVIRSSAWAQGMLQERGEGVRRGREEGGNIQTASSLPGQMAIASAAAPPFLVPGPFAPAGEREESSWASRDHRGDEEETKEEDEEVRRGRDNLSDISWPRESEPSPFLQLQGLAGAAQIADREGRGGAAGPALPPLSSSSSPLVSRFYIAPPGGSSGGRETAAMPTMVAAVTKKEKEERKGEVALPAEDEEPSFVSFQISSSAGVRTEEEDIEEEGEELVGASSSVGRSFRVDPEEETDEAEIGALSQGRSDRAERSLHGAQPLPFLAQAPSSSLPNVCPHCGAESSGSPSPFFSSAPVSSFFCHRCGVALSYSDTGSDGGGGRRGYGRGVGVEDEENLEGGAPAGRIEEIDL